MTDQTTLATKTCVPCKGGVPRLDRRQAEDLIASPTYSWWPEFIG